MCFAAVLIRVAAEFIVFLVLSTMAFQVEISGHRELILF